MMHAFLILLFVVTITYWLSFEFPDQKIAWQRQWKWIAVATILPILGSALSLFFGGKPGNFLLHTLGGGVAAACIFKYLSGILNLNLNWRLSLIGMFVFASALGVVNELAEYAGESLRLGIFSFDTQDTWRDLSANTLGVVVGWVIITAITRNKKRTA